MTTPAPDSVPRLDSWKAIADYLRRDVATVRRWEKTAGLPVHPLPGGRGMSVFAYTAEIDAWLSGAGREEARAEEHRSGAAAPIVSSRRWPFAALVLLVVVATGAGASATKGSDGHTITAAEAPTDAKPATGDD